MPNLIEEIESLGKQQRQELRNRLSVLIGNLLKWQYQPERRSRSGETNLPEKTFPQDCPYAFEQILDDRFYPGEPSAEMEENC